MTSKKKRPGQLTVGTMFDPETVPGLSALDAITKPIRDIQRMWDLYSRPSRLLLALDQAEARARILSGLPNSRLQATLDTIRQIDTVTIGPLDKLARTIAASALPIHEFQHTNAALRALDEAHSQFAARLAAVERVAFPAVTQIRELSLPSGAARILRDRELAATKRLEATLNAVSVFEQHLAFLSKDQADPNEPNRRKRVLESIKNLLASIEALAKDYPFLFVTIVGGFVVQILWSLLTATTEFVNTGDLTEQDQQVIVGKLTDICEKVDVRYVRVRSHQAPIRAEMGRAGKILFYAHEGDTFCQAARKDNWLMVQQLIRADGGDITYGEGWVSAYHVEPLDKP